MRGKYLLTCIRLTAKLLLRNRIIAVLLLIIPAVFFTVTRYTASNTPVWFKLTSVSEDAIINVSQRHMAIVFIALTVSGLLSSFLSFNLIQNNKEEHKRLILCGYRSGEIVLSKFLLMMTIVLFISVYISAVINFFFKPDNIMGVMGGLLLIGFVYGSYGMLIGTMLRGDLEGILFIVLLANLDVAWLQNPVYYLAAQNKEFIRSLPSYFPSQACMVSAFSEHGILKPVLGSISYGLIFLVIALFIFDRRMRIRGKIYISKTETQLDNSMPGQKGYKT